MRRELLYLRLANLSRHSKKQTDLELLADSELPDLINRLFKVL
jgi:hypothetical protein